jgi:hypothetical protein
VKFEIKEFDNQSQPCLDLSFDFRLVRLCLIATELHLDRAETPTKKPLLLKNYLKQLKKSIE